MADCTSHLQCLDAFFSVRVFLHPSSLPECKIFRVGTGLAPRCVHCLAQQDPGFGVAQTAAVILSRELLSSLGVTGLLWECFSLQQTGSTLHKWP